MAGTDRTDVASLIKEGFGTEFLTNAAEGSTILSAFPNRVMTEGTDRLPVENGGAVAHFTKQYARGAENSDAIKKTSIASWGDKELVAEELAHIIAVHENDIQDASIDLLGSLTRQGSEAIAVALDDAVINGGAPASWGTSFNLAAINSDQELTVGTDAIDPLDALVEAEGILSDNGFSDVVFVTEKSFRNRLRYGRNADNGLILGGDVLDDFNPVFTKALGSDTIGYMVARNAVVVGKRLDPQIKLLTEATLTDVGNLAELDMVGLRFAARYAYQLKSDSAVVAVRRVPQGS